MHRLTIRREHLLSLSEAAKRVYPIEACALLLGTRRQKDSTVHRMALVDNVERSTVTFRVDAHALLRIYDKADRNGLELVAIFHSHPAPPRPSAIDREYMRVNPVVWLILSVPDGTYGAFQYREGRIEPVEIVETTS